MFNTMLNTEYSGHSNILGGPGSPKPTPGYATVYDVLLWLLHKKAPIKINYDAQRAVNFRQKFKEN